MITQFDVHLRKIIENAENQMQLILDLKGLLRSFEDVDDMPPEVVRFGRDNYDEYKKADKEKVRHLKRVITGLEAIMEVKG